MGFSTHVSKSSKVHYRGGPMTFENRAQPFPILDVADLKRPPFHCRSISA